MSVRILPLSFLVILGLVAQVGCGGGSPTWPELAVTNPRVLQSAANPHRLVSFGMIRLDPDSDTFSLVPARAAGGHLNALYLLEHFPCTDCLRIDTLSKLTDSEYLVELILIHPGKENNLKVTAFDVRGIFMFESNSIFPGFGLTWSDPTTSSANLLNPYGYTTLYNPVHYSDESLLQGYLQGAYATTTPPDAMLNPYIDFDPVSNRRPFTPGSQAKATLHVNFPTGTTQFGYAIDASWELPLVDPPTNIPDDFSVTANIPEPFALLIDPVINTLYYQSSVSMGGEIGIDVKVYDWQGGQPSTEGGSINAIHMESPDLFEAFDAEALSWEPGYDPLPYILYRFNLEPTPPWPGTYPLLVAVEDVQPGLIPGTDATAYQVTWIDVASAPVNLPPVADGTASSPFFGNTPLTVTLDPNYSYDPDGTIVLYEWDVNDDGIYELVSSTPDAVGWIFSEPGHHKVFLRVTDNEGLSGIGHILIDVDAALLQPPVADLSLSGPTSGPAPLAVTLDATLSYDPDGTIVLWEWDVDGDSTWEFTLGTPAILIYTYHDQGEYTLRLRVKDDDENTDTDEVLIQVE